MSRARWAARGALVATLLLIPGCAGGPAAPRADSDDGERHIELDGQPNFRDIGGYETADGRTVKWGQVYRSGELPQLSDADVERLSDLGVVTVVNFLTQEEIEHHGADRLPPSVQEVRQSIDTSNNVALELIDARETGDFTAVPPDLNPEIHRMLTDEARDQYAALYRAIIEDDQRPLVFHCSHGIHRTGTAAAVLLWSLGVPWETVREDYLLSNEYRQDETRESLARLRQLAASRQGIAVEDVDTTNMDAFFILDGSYIDATRDYILEEFGSADAYLRDGLGLTDTEVRALRETLLE